MNKANFYNLAMLQVFVGRMEKANIEAHKGLVFKVMQSFDWLQYHELGFNTIYLHGIFDNRSPIMVSHEDGVDLSQAGIRLPSVFAISDHKQLNPELGSVADFVTLVEVLHQSNFKVITDFVPNHTSTNHVWITDHPEYYHWQNGEVLKEFSGDVCKLNYDCLGLQNEMIGVMEWIMNLKVDGIRVDMAHLVPISFWERSLGNLKLTYPELVSIAEAYADNLFDLSGLQALQTAGFDYIYHEPLYRNIRNLFERKGSLEDLHAHLSYVISQSNQHDSHSAMLGDESLNQKDKDLRSLFGFSHDQSPIADEQSETFPSNSICWLNYLGNHDDMLSAVAYPYVETLLPLMLSMPKGFMVYLGMFAGLTRRLSHHSLEILSHDISLTSSVSPIARKWFSYKKEFGLKAVDTRIESGALVLNSIRDDETFCEIWLNLSSQPIPVKDISQQTGLILGIQTQDFLAPNQSELFDRV